MSVQQLVQEAKAASAAMGRANSSVKNQALETIASELEKNGLLDEQSLGLHGLRKALACMA